MATFLKTLTILLATAAMCHGSVIKKSEKRGIYDFGSGFSSSRLEGSGIKISTDFGKEITLEEYKKNGFNFGDSTNLGLGFGFGSNLNGLAANGITNNNFGFGNLFGNGFNFAQGLGGILQTNQPNEIQKITQETNSNNQGVQEEQISQLNQSPSTESLSNTQEPNPVESQTLNLQAQNQNIPQNPQVQITAQPAFIHIPQQVPGSTQGPQPYHIQFMKPYPVHLNHPLFISTPQNIPEQQKQEVPGYNVVEQSDNQNNAASTSEQKNEEPNSQTRSNQIITHESETTINKSFIPSTYHGRSLFDSQSSQVSQKTQTPVNYLQTQIQPDHNRENSLPNGNEQSQISLTQLQQLVRLGLSGNGQGYPVQAMYNVADKM